MYIISKYSFILSFPIIFVLLFLFLPFFSFHISVLPLISQMFIYLYLTYIVSLYWKLTNLLLCDSLRVLSVEDQLSSVSSSFYFYFQPCNKNVFIFLTGIVQIRKIISETSYIPRDYCIIFFMNDAKIYIFTEAKTHMI